MKTEWREIKDVKRQNMTRKSAWYCKEMYNNESYIVNYIDKC